jgi:predicted NBD/HSP70 family sugar kinase
MSALGLDLGGTKLASALFSSSGLMSDKRIEPLNHKSGESVGNLITDQIQFIPSAFLFRVLADPNQEQYGRPIFPNGRITHY